MRFGSSCQVPAVIFGNARSIAENVGTSVCLGVIEIIDHRLVLNLLQLLAMRSW